MEGFKNSRSITNIEARETEVPKQVRERSPLACSAFNCFSNPGRGSFRSARRENSSYGKHDLSVSSTINMTLKMYNGKDEMDAAVCG